MRLAKKGDTSSAEGWICISKVLPFLTTIIFIVPHGLLPHRMMFFGARVILFLYSEMGMVGDHLNRSDSSSVCLYRIAGRYWQR